VRTKEVTVKCLASSERDWVTEFCNESKLLEFVVVYLYMILSHT
jgi:hypothetical protein